MVKPQTDENVLFFGRADFGKFSEKSGFLETSFDVWGRVVCAIGASKLPKSKGENTLSNVSKGGIVLKSAE